MLSSSRCACLLLAPGLVPQLIAPNVSLLIIPQFSPELGSQMSAASQLEILGNWIQQQLGSPMTSSSYKLVVLPFLRKEFGLLPNKKKVYLMVFAPSLLPLAFHQQSLCIWDFITKEMKHHSYPLSA